MSEEWYPHFSEAEMNRRHAAAKSLMQEVGIDTLLFFGMGGTNRNAQANIYWLSCYRDFNHCYLIFPKDGPPSLFTGLYNHLHNAQMQCIFEDVRHGAYGNPERMADQLDALGLGNARIGLVGVNPRFKILLPFEHMDYLTERFPEAQWVDVSARFRDLRLVKSEEEIEWLIEAARLTDLAMEAAIIHAKPGIPEIELSGRMAAAFREQGGEQMVQFVTATPMANPRTPVPWQNPTRRKLEAGDVLIIEISAAYYGYAGQSLRTFTIGADPTPPYQGLLDAAIEVYEGVGKTMKAGNSAQAVFAATDPLPEKGFQIYDSLAHGFGTDLLQPSIGIRGSNYLAPPAEFKYRENMVMVIQPNPMDSEGRGVQMGDMGVVTKDGFRSLHTFPMKTFRCDG